MNHIQRAFVVLIVILCNVPAYAGTIYRWLDEGGGITYSSCPPLQSHNMKGVEKIEVPTSPNVALPDDPARERIACERFMAENESFFDCETEGSCRKAFALAQIFVSDNADTKIQIATDSIVETYNPLRDGSVGLKVSKIPGKGHSAKIALKVACKVEINRQDEFCQDRAINLYKAFPQFMARSMQ